MAHYRDRETGRFVGKSTWTRSHAQGGTRYVREFHKEKKVEKELPPPEEEIFEEFEEDEEAEYEGAFDSP